MGHDAFMAVFAGWNHREAAGDDGLSVIMAVMANTPTPELERCSRSRYMNGVVVAGTGHPSCVEAENEGRGKKPVCLLQKTRCYPLVH